MPREVLSFLELPPSHPVASISGMGTTGGSGSSTNSIVEGTRSGMRLVTSSTDTMSHASVGTASDIVSTSSHPPHDRREGQGEAQGQGLGYSPYTNTSTHTPQLPASKSLSHSIEPSQHRSQLSDDNESSFNDNDDGGPSSIRIPSNTPDSSNQHTSGSSNHDTKDSYKHGFKDDFSRKHAQGQGLGQSIPTKIPSEKTATTAGDKQGGMKLSWIDLQIRYEIT